MSAPPPAPDQEDPAGYGYRTALRVDMSTIPNRVARVLLEEYGALVYRAVTRTVGRRYKSAACDLDDCLSVGRVALFEAVQTFDTRAQVTLSTWVFRVVSWRVSGFLTQTQGLQKAGLHQVSLDAERAAGTTSYTLHEVLTDDAAAGDYEALADTLVLDARLSWVGDVARARLNQRELVVLDGVIRGESGAQVARSLGISRQRVSVHFRRGFAKLQAAVGSAKSGLVGTDPGALTPPSVDG